MEKTTPSLSQMIRAPFLSSILTPLIAGSCLAAAGIGFDLTAFSLVLIIGIDELSKADRILYDRARKLLNFLTQPFFTAEAYTGKKGEYVSFKDTLSGCEKIINGRFKRCLISIRSV